METGCKNFTCIVASSHRVHKNLYALELMSVQWREWGVFQAKNYFRIT